MRRTRDNRSDRPSRLSIFMRRQRRMARPVALALVFLIVIAGGAAVLRDMRSEERFAPIRARLVSLLPLRVTDIQVSGRTLTDEAALRDALGVRIGDPVLGFSVEAARQRIDALPFVDHSVVERHLPGTIVVRLTERRPFAVWQNQGRFMLIDRAGNPVQDQGPGQAGLSGKDAQAFLQLPLVVGPDANLAAAPLMDMLAGQPVVLAHMAAAVRVGQRRWNLLLHDGTTVLLPEGEEIPALKRLAELQDSMKLLDRPVISIDLRLPDRLVVQQPPPAADPVAPNGAAQDGKAPNAGPPGADAGTPPAPHPAAHRPNPAGPATSHGESRPAASAMSAPLAAPVPAPAPAPVRPRTSLPASAPLPPPVPNLPPMGGEPAQRNRA
ncbi:cell division protein FtsQ/DivIB [Gluconacetobacter diazotrophicus]|uniref:Cell division protein FtsQ n=1 Tax=Gluconacetobacter diazotrophicus (strain ATCC 49037 / DSM 5601 / CCUG 37298 / CIP 103539 / LMG 7603 / PAl5) TaxID=272568 RepID=A9H0J9_GLUDA|nr:cell division protein FtsQ/DivIB [Gluconacetobacter diazotrophicus]CAP57137.1 putative cell division protein ftsQ [Gluconacetobacter diazotrophicus PA1 5]